MRSTDGPRRRLGLTLKVFAATALVVVVVLGVTLVLTSTLARRNAERSLDVRLANTGEVARSFIEAENAKLASGAAAAAQVPTLIAAVATGDPGTVLDQALTYKDILGADYTLITDRHAVLLAHTDFPGIGGDTLGGPVIGRALAGEQIAGYVGREDRDRGTLRFYLVVATPLKDLASGVVHAMLLAGHQVTDSLAEEVKRATGSEIVFYLFDFDDRPVVAASTIPRSAALDSAVHRSARAELMAEGSTIVRAEARMDGGEYVGFNRTLINEGSERPIGGYIALRSLDEETAGFRRLQRILYAVGGVGLLLALAASLLVARQISGPVRALVGATSRVADGDLSVEVPAGSSDEIGELASAFRRMVEELKAKQQLVEYLSGAASAAATQPVHLAGGDLASPTMMRSAHGGTGMLAVGQMLGNRYEIKSILGVGGMGVVYRAHDGELGEPVAIKTLKADALASDPALLQRFKDEIRLARRITHRNVVRTHDLGEVEGMYYITMELVEGQSLKHLIQSRGSLPVNVALTVGKQLTRALEVAHEVGVIHRDIKPQNIVIEPSGTLKVMDFGIARLASRTEGVTQAGMAIGTPEYMAPEQLLGGDVDFRTDIYATGCVLFECLCGRPPFTADSAVTLVAKQLEEDPPSPSALNREVPDELAAVVVRCLAKDPADRPGSALELHDALASLAG